MMKKIEISSRRTRALDVSERADRALVHRKIYYCLTIARLFKIAKFALLLATILA